MKRLLLVLLLCACPKPKPVYKPPVVIDPVADVKARVADLYAVLTAQEPDRLGDLLTQDAMVFGLGPKDAYTDRDEAIDATRTQLIPIGLKGDTFKVTHSNVKVGLAHLEGSAWFYDFPRFEQVRPGKAPKHWAARVTGHAVREEGWRIDALHVSFGFPDAQLYADDAPKKLKVLASPGTDRGSDTEPLVGATKRMLDDIALKIERTSDAETAVLIGTDPNDVYEGGARFKALARPKLAELKKAPFTLKIEDGPRAMLSPDHKTGWVAANVVLRLTVGKKQQTLPAFRALWIFQQEGELWNLVSEHQSLGLLPEQRQQAGDDEGGGAADGGSD
jgi:hypothetical protein